MKGSRSREQHTQNGYRPPPALRGGLTTAAWWRTGWGLSSPGSDPAVWGAMLTVGETRRWGLERAELWLGGRAAMAGLCVPHPHGHISSILHGKKTRGVSISPSVREMMLFATFRGLLVTNIAQKAPQWATRGLSPHLSSSLCPSVFSSVQPQQTRGDAPLDELPASAGERTEIGAECPFLFFKS